jgi:3-oxoadipate CoA-transferase beta subunit
VVKRIYTNLAVIDVTPSGLVVREMVAGMDLAQLQSLTEPKLQLAADWRVLTPPLERRFDKATAPPERAA